MQWKDYIATLIKLGVTKSQIAKQALCGTATISDLASGKTREPRYSLGVALIGIGLTMGVETPDLRLDRRSKEAA